MRRAFLAALLSVGTVSCKSSHPPSPANGDSSNEGLAPTQEEQPPSSAADASTSDNSLDTGLSPTGPRQSLPTPPSTSFISNPNFPNCVHPGVVQSCEGGWCRIPAGCFVYGSPESEYGRAKYDEAQASVPLSHDFEIQQTEVTRQAWLDTGWDIPTVPLASTIGNCKELQCPMDRLAWFQALRYANWVSEQSGLDPCYALTDCKEPAPLDTNNDLTCNVQVNASNVYECEGYRLPTSAEWEYAARAGTVAPFYSRAMLPETLSCQLDVELARIGWYCANTQGDGLPQERPVALLEANAWGLYDVIGNVSEWVSDDFGGVSWLDPYPDPEGQVTSSTQGTTRSCVFYSDQWGCRAAMKLPVPRKERNAGFRLARTLAVGTPPTLNDADAAPSQ